MNTSLANLKLATGRDDIEIHCEFIGKDGSVIWSKCINNKVKFKSGRMILPLFM